MNAPRYRIGNDLSVFWAIHNRDGSPFSMEGKNIRLFVTNERERREVYPILTSLPDGTINNVIRWDYKGDDQKVLGLHTLTVEISEFNNRREITKDYCEAFSLVSRSDIEVDEEDANISIGGDLILASKLDIYRFELTNADLSGVKETLHDINDSLEDINEAIGDINEEALNIKVTINGIQSTVNDIGTEMTTKASVDSVIELGDQITEVQHNVAEQTIKVNSLGAEISTKASAESVTKIADELTITSEALAEQTLKVTDLGAEIATKASADSVVELQDGLRITNESLAEQVIKVDSLSSEISTKASVESVATLEGGLETANKAIGEQTIKVDSIESTIKTLATAESVTEATNALGERISTTDRSLAEQAIKVTSLESEIKTKASTESVTKVGDDVINISNTVAEQIIRTDELEASIETLVSKEEFDVETGKISDAYSSVKQTVDGLATTVKGHDGAITVIEQNINGLSVDIGKVSDNIESLRGQIDGVTESYFYDYTPTLENEPAVSWINEGKEKDHEGDTFTNTATEGDDAGKSWRWLQNSEGEWSWYIIADTDAQKALLLAAQAQAAADGKVTIFYQQPNQYKYGDIWFVHNDDYDPYKKGEILSANTTSTIFNLNHWESKTRFTQAVEELDETMNTTFRDGVIDDAERKSIVTGLANLEKEKSAVDTRHNILLINSNFTEEELKKELKSAKTSYDTAYDSLSGIVNQIIKAETEELKDLFLSYETASTTYGEAYAAYISCEERVNEALMGRLNPASIYLDNITNDGVLTPIEKEQLFEIYRSIAKEYSAYKDNARNYKIWKPGTDGKTEIPGLNGGEGRFETYITFKEAYIPIAEIFGSSLWGFDKMSETTALPEGYSTTEIKSKLDAYYSALGTLSEIFSAITIFIQEAQQKGEQTLNELTDILTPEEMQTLVGKGVVLSTIIATKDKDGNITAGMNASDEFKDDTHGRIVFVGGVKDTTDWLNANFVLFEDGHTIQRSGEIKDGVRVGSALLNSVVDGEINLLSYTRKVNGEVVSTPLFYVETDEAGNIVNINTPYNFHSTKEISAGGAGEEGDFDAIGTVTGIKVDDNDIRTPDGNGTVDISDVINSAIEDIDLSEYAKTAWVTQQISASTSGITSEINDLKSKDVKHDTSINAILERLAEAEKITNLFEANENGVRVKDNFYSDGEISAGGSGEEGDFSAEGTVTGIKVAEGNIVYPDNNGTVDLSDVLEDVIGGIDLTPFATKDEVDNRFDELVNGAPAALDTLKEIADALAENDNEIGAIVTEIGTKASKTEVAAIDSKYATEVNSLKEKNTAQDNAHSELARRVTTNEGKIENIEGDIDDINQKNEEQDESIAEINDGLPTIKQWYNEVGRKIGYDEHGIYTRENFRSYKEISAGGVGQEDEGGGGSGEIGGIQIEIIDRDFPDTPEGIYQEGSQVIGYDNGKGIWTNKVTMYKHQQSTSSDKWTITHNLGKMPNVKVIDSQGELVFGTVVYDKNDLLNKLTITFGGAFAGTAYLD